MAIRWQPSTDGDNAGATGETPNLLPPTAETQIRNAKPGEKTRKIFDGSGPYLEVSPTGSRWWRFKYRIDGKEKCVSLGVYPEITLKRARERCMEARRLVAEGIDPSAQRKAAKATVQDTFEALAREYFDVNVVAPCRWVPLVARPR